MTKASAPKGTAPAKKSAPKKKADAGASTQSTPGASTSKGKSKLGPNASFYEALSSRGFKEVNQQGENVEGGDYTKGWNGLTAAKTSATFTNGKRRIETSIDGGGAPTIKIFDGKSSSPVFHSVGGHLPSDETWDSLMGTKKDSESK